MFYFLLVPPPQTVFQNTKPHYHNTKEKLNILPRVLLPLLVIYFFLQSMGSVCLNKERETGANTINEEVHPVSQPAINLVGICRIVKNATDQFPNGAVPVQYAGVVEEIMCTKVRIPDIQESVSDFLHNQRLSLFVSLFLPFQGKRAIVPELFFTVSGAKEFWELPPPHQLQNLPLLCSRRTPVRVSPKWRL